MGEFTEIKPKIQGIIPKRVEAFDGRLWVLAEVEKRHQEKKPKPVGKPKFVPGPSHPWRRYVLKAKKGQKQITG